MRCRTGPLVASTGELSMLSRREVPATSFGRLASIATSVVLVRRL
jgi:hypothetical protein